MKKQNFNYLTYIIVFIACTLSIGNKMFINNSYQNIIDKYSYQLGYKDTYSSDFSPYSDNIVETATGKSEDSDISQPKTVYLTFDDGPSPRTEEILNILKENNIKATFFVVKREEKYTPNMIRAAEDGHTIGVHTASHKYSDIYKDITSYLDDFTECSQYIEDNTGIKPSIFRFPGGSVNNYNQSICRQLIDEMTRRGYVYYDWNVDSGDGTGKLSSRQIYNNVVSGCKGRSRAIVIMHDSIGKNSTVEALPDIIRELKEDGWIFEKLDNNVKPMVFRLK